VVERWLRTVEPVKQLRQGEGIHAPGCSIRDPAFTGSRDRDREARPGSPNAVTVRGTTSGTWRLNDLWVHVTLRATNGSKPVRLTLEGAVKSGLRIACAGSLR
jgi:hypothetical protein